jgi:two-component system, OmpR family, alkaline phosphatase synthesis response regulator PhoP
MKQKSILVVDDDTNIQELISVNLLAAGYRIMNATNGKEAMETIKNGIPDLIILDIMMPEIDGWELCKWVRDDPLLENIKILMLTAKGTEKDKLIGREIFRANDYMTKPFDIDQLTETVARLLHD